MVSSNAGRVQRHRDQRHMDTDSDSVQHNLPVQMLTYLPTQVVLLRMHTMRYLAPCEVWGWIAARKLGPPSMAGGEMTGRAHTGRGSWQESCVTCLKHAGCWLIPYVVQSVVAGAAQICGEALFLIENAPTFGLVCFNLRCLSWSNLYSACRQRQVAKALLWPAGTISSDVFGKQQVRGSQTSMLGCCLRSSISAYLGYTVLCLKEKGWNCSHLAFPHPMIKLEEWFEDDWLCRRLVALPRCSPVEFQLLRAGTT